METILITGANRGLGLEFARQYSEAGKRVIATCRNPGEASALDELSERFAGLSVERLDLQSDEDIEGLSRSLVERSVELDLIISNAGVLLGENFGAWTRQGFTDTLDVNVSGAALLAQTLAPILSGSGKLVHLSSGLGSLEWAGEGMIDADSYSISKAALNMVTVRLASVFRGTSRCVVSMSPGWVATNIGGSGATLAVEQSVSKMIPAIEALTVRDSGRFIDNQGNSIPW